MRTLCVGDIHGANKALSQVLERAKFTDNDTLIVLGDITDGYPETPQCIETLLGIKNLIYVIGNHDCLSEDTEVFTMQGWKRYIDVSKNDLVVGLNANGLSEWQRINEIIIKESEGINVFESQRVSMAITDTHRILHKTVGGFKYNTVKEYDPNNSRYQIPLASFSNINKDSDVNISDLEIQLMAWILTDGSITKNGDIVLYQSKLDTLDRIELILKELKIKYNKYSRQPYIKEICGRILKKQPLRSYSLHLPRIFSHEFIDKFKIEKNAIPACLYKCSYRQARIFIEETLLGDGSSYKKVNCHIVYGTEKFLGYLQGLCSINGVACTLTKSNRGDFRLNMNESLFAKLRGDFKKEIGKKKVWCLSVPLTNFLVRRNGKSFFTGNSWLWDWLRLGLRPIIWTEQGGKATIAAYLKDAKVNPKPLMIKHRDFFKKALPYYIDSENRCFVHGGIPLYTDIYSATVEELSWDRNTADAVLRGLNITEHRFKEIYLGHTTTERYTDKPIIRNNIILMDTGAGWGGKLSLMDVDTKEVWQSDKVSTLYPECKGRN